MRTITLLVGLLVTAFGAFAALQALGYVAGSRPQVWGVIGALLAGFGVALMITAIRGPRK